MTLDLLRIIACAVVLLAHGGSMLDAVAPGLRVWLSRHAMAWLAVEVFFVLSGFLITRLLLQYRDRPAPWRTFIVRRSARIFPAYFLTMTALALAAWLAPGLILGRVHWSAFLYGFNFVLAADPGIMERTTNGQIWSLCVEEQFYLLFPLVVLLLPRRWVGPAIAWGMLPLGVVLIAAIAGRGDAQTYYSTAPHLLGLGAGALLAVHETWARSRSAIGAALGLVLVGLCTYAPVGVMFGQSTDVLTRAVGRAVLSAGVVLGALSAVEPLIPQLAPALANSLTTAGMMTYSIYLQHGWIFRVIRGRAPHDPLGFAVAVALTVGIAAASYRWIEQPIMQLARRWKPKRESPPAGADGPGVAQGDGLTGSVPS